MKHITGKYNPVVKLVKSLKERKYREETKLFFIEGVRLVEEALNENAAIEKLVVCERLSDAGDGKELLDKAIKGKYDVYSVPNEVFDGISDTENPQGVLAVLKAGYIRLEDVLKKENFLVILDSIQDPGNLGTIIRTAEAAGVSGVILLKGCVDLYNPKVLRSTMGSIFRIPLCYADNRSEAMNMIKSAGTKVFALHMKSSESCFDADFNGNIAIVAGNEANGIGNDIIVFADALVKIPMAGRLESLNVSVAAGLAMFEAARQRDYARRP